MPALPSLRWRRHGTDGLRRSSGRTKPEYTAASGRRDHATFGSGPTRQSDERDSEPDYLLRPTRHGPGGTLLDYSAFRFRAQVTENTVGTKTIQRTSLKRHLLRKWTLRFESAITEAAAFAASSAIAHIPCAVYSRSTVTEKDSKRAIVGSTESQQLYPTAVDSYGQTLSLGFTLQQKLTDKQ